MASGPFTLAQLAQVVGMKFEDVEFYWECGLLQPARRGGGRPGDPGYHQEHVDRLRFIGRALDHGFSLDAIGQLVDLYALRTCGDIYRIGTRELEALRQRLGADSQKVTALESLLAKCSKVGGRQECPVLTAFAE